MYNKNETLHIIILVIYCIIMFIPTIIVFIFIFSNSSRSYYLTQRRQGLLLITTLGSISLGFSEIYDIGLNDPDTNFIIIKINIHYFFIIPCFVSYCYRGIIIYYEYIKNTEKLYDNINKMEIIINKIKIIKKICFGILFSTFIYLLIIDILYFYNILEININFLYPYYVITGIYVFIMHPLIIYLLHKIKNNIKYDYILTIMIIGFNYIIIVTFLNDKHIVNYSESICAMLNYIAYLILPLIYVIKNTKNKDINIKNNIKMLNKNNFKINFIDLYNDYIEIKNIYKNTDFKIIYKEFYKNKIKCIKNIDENNYKSLIDYINIIEYNIENDIINLDIFDNLFDEIKSKILIDLYKQNVNLNNE